MFDIISAVRKKNGVAWYYMGFAPHTVIGRGSKLAWEPVSTFTQTFYIARWGFTIQSIFFSTLQMLASMISKLSSSRALLRRLSAICSKLISDSVPDSSGRIFQKRNISAPPVVWCTQSTASSLPEFVRGAGRFPLPRQPFLFAHVMLLFVSPQLLRPCRFLCSL